MKKKLLVETSTGIREIRVGLSGRTIFVTNGTNVVVYIASYFRLIGTIFQENFMYRLQEEPIEIKPNETKEIQRTSHDCFVSRKATLLFTRERSILEDRLPRFGVCHISHKALFFSRHETIVLHQGLLTCVSSLKRENSFFDGEVGNGPVLVRSLPIKNVAQTSVKVVNRRCHYISPLKLPIGPQEGAALKNRKEFIRRSLASYLSEEEEFVKGIRVPNISVCFSGGSYRGMFATIGFLQGLIDTGLYDCISYLTGLSGSCWALGLWFAKYKEGFEAMSEQLARKMQLSIREAYSPEVKKFIKSLKKQSKELDLPKTSLVDLYQGLITHQLFDDLKPSGYTYDFDDLNNYCNFETGQLPFPIFTSAFKEPHNYEWMEFTPFEAGSHYMGGFVPTNRFGSYFQQGEMMKQAPCLTLSRIMSFACSVQCLTIYKLLREVAGPQLETASDVLNAIGSHPPPELLPQVDTIFIQEDEYESQDSHPNQSNNNLQSDKCNRSSSSSSGSGSRSSSCSSGSSHSSVNGSKSKVNVSIHNNGSQSDYHIHISTNNQSESESNVSYSGQSSISNSDCLSSDLSSNSDHLLKPHGKETKKEKKVRKKREKEKRAAKKKNKKKQSNISRVATTTANLVDLSQRMSDKYLFRPASFPNFAYGLAGSPIKHKKFVKLVDAGFSFCLPLPPLLQVKERVPDIMIIVEMSSTPNCEVGQSLKEAMEWVKARNIKLPPVDINRARVPFPGGGHCVVFKDEKDLSLPILVYVVLQKNEEFGDFDPIQNMNDGGFCSTFNYRYTREQIDSLTGLMRQTAASIDPVLKQLIREVIRNKPADVAHHAHPHHNELSDDSGFSGQDSEEEDKDENENEDHDGGDDDSDDDSDDDDDDDVVDYDDSDDDETDSDEKDSDKKGCEKVGDDFKDNEVNVEEKERR